VLTKTSAANYATAWTTPASGGGGTNTLYNGVAYYQVNSGTQETWIKSSGTMFSGLSWTRSGTVATITHPGHGLANTDYVWARGLGTNDRIYSQVQNVSTDTFDITVANSGATSGSSCAYMGAFYYSSASATGITINAITSTALAADITLMAIVTSTGTRASNGQFVWTLPTSAKNGGVSNNTVPSLIVASPQVSDTTGANVAGVTLTLTASSIATVGLTATASRIIRLVLS
jgi:hypothetical protein